MPAEALYSTAEELFRFVVGFVDDLFAPMDAEIDTDHTLPVGKGALILIFGGLFALGTSLFLVMFSPRPVPAGLPAHRTRSPEMAFQAVSDTPRPQGPSPGRDWIGQLSEETRRCGYGQADLMAAGGGVWRVRLAGCASCRTRTARSAREGCRAERRTVERVARGAMPEAEVIETSCRSRLQDACIFEIRAGRR